MPGRAGKPARNQHRMELTKWSSGIVWGGARQLRLQEGRPVLGRRTVFFCRFTTGSADPGSPDPCFPALPAGNGLSSREPLPLLGRRSLRARDTAPVRRGGWLSSREGEPVLGRRPQYLRPLREAGRSVREREGRSWVAGPSIHGSSARRVAQFARGSAGPGSPDPLFTALARGGSLSLREAVPVRQDGSPSLREAVPIRQDGSLSLREGVPVLGRRPHYLRHLREAGRSVCERQRRSGETGRSVCERECWSWAAGPIIYGTSARRVAQFARGSAVRGRRPHYLRHFRGHPRGGGWEAQSRR